MIGLPYFVLAVLASPFKSKMRLALAPDGSDQPFDKTVLPR
jgi:hypothetical protein